MAKRKSEGFGLGGFGSLNLGETGSLGLGLGGLSGGSLRIDRDKDTDLGLNQKYDDDLGLNPKKHTSLIGDSKPMSLLGSESVPRPIRQVQENIGRQTVRTSLNAPKIQGVGAKLGERLGQSIGNAIREKRNEYARKRVIKKTEQQYIKDTHGEDYKDASRKDKKILRDDAKSKIRAQNAHEANSRKEYCFRSIDPETGNAKTVCHPLSSVISLKINQERSRGFQTSQIFQRKKRG